MAEKTKVVGIVAEYNPFHNGHRHLIEECRKNGATHIVAVMSGNFVQRGSVAIMDKRARAAAAIGGGVDLVLELPVCRAVATAELFAKGGVSVLGSLGCVSTLAFGAECCDAKLLEKTAEAVCDIRVHERIKSELEGGVSYPVARESAVNQIYGSEIASVITEPNNILAVEYIKALRGLGLKMEIEPVLRAGTAHDSMLQSGELASASALRILLERGDKKAYDYMPPSTVAQFEALSATGRAPVCIDDSERAILSRLRLLTPEDIKKAPDVSEGLENRIYNAILTATSLQELYDIVKTKRYTHSRIRRIITALYLGITPEDSAAPVPYIRVLGFNERGREVLKVAKETAKLPVIMKSSQSESLPEFGKRVFDLECKATDLYNLCTPRILPCGTDRTDEIVML